MKKSISLMIMLLLMMSPGTARAETSQLPVGEILGLKGGEHGRKAWITTADGRRTSASLRAGDRVCVGDTIETADGTTLTIEFAIGGQATISPNKTVVINGRDGVRQVGNPVLVKARHLWSKIDRQKEALQITTAGGVIGVEG